MSSLGSPATREQPPLTAAGGSPPQPQRPSTAENKLKCKKKLLASWPAALSSWTGLLHQIRVDSRLPGAGRGRRDPPQQPPAMLSLQTGPCLSPPSDGASVKANRSCVKNVLIWELQCCHRVETANHWLVSLELLRVCFPALDAPG